MNVFVARYGLCALYTYKLYIIDLTFWYFLFQVNDNLKKRQIPVEKVESLTFRYDILLPLL